MSTITQAAIRQNGLRPPTAQAAQPAAKPQTATAPGAAPAARPAGGNRGGTLLTNPLGLGNDTVQRKTLLTA